MITPASPVSNFLQGQQGAQQNKLLQMQMQGVQQSQAQQVQTFQQGQQDRVQAQRRAMLEDLGQASDWILQAQDPNEQLGRLEQAKQVYRPVFGEGVDSFTLEQLPMLRAQVQAELGGKAPAGYRPTPDGNLEPIPGGPADPKNAASNQPAGVLEYEYFNTLTPEQQEEYLRVKRGEREPSSTLEKRLFDVNDAAFKASSNVVRYNNLAQQMIDVDPQSGLAGKWTETLKAVTGSEDAVTMLRKEWNNLRVSNAVQNLPPGVASDKDIELVMSAFLPEFADAGTVAAFMRGLAKLEAIKAEYHEFEADYLSENGSAIGLNRAWRERLNALEPPAPTNGAPANPENADPLGLRKPQ